MHPLQKQFHDEINEKQLFRKDEKVLLAVSGGIDSMVLAHLFLSLNHPFGIAHCNFGLRDEESDKDEQLVRDWAKKSEIECHVKRFDLEGSIQLAAREARYKWFDELIEVNDYAIVATAHHLNDSLETALFNLVRGTGIKGISAISPKINKIIRPLLFATKDQLMTYAKDQGISWREDASNTKTDYGRNLIRNKVIPTLRELNPSLEETFKLTLERFQLTNSLLDQSVDDVRNKYLKKEKAFWRLDTGWIKKDVDLLILSEIVSGFGFNYVTAKEIFNALDKSGKVFTSDHFELSIDRSSLFIRRHQDDEGKSLIISGVGIFTIDDSTIKVSSIKRKDVSFNSNRNIAFFDAAKACFPLEVKPWKEGDRFKPLGMSGTKKISDYLIDNKVPLFLKEHVKVISSGYAIIWLVGHQISDDFKITDESESVLKIEWA